jgi:hypothetical protein
MKRVIFALSAAIFSYEAVAQKIATDKVPAAVTTAFKAKFPTVEKSSWEMESKTEFEVNFKLNSNEISASFDDTGKWLETETEIKVSALSSAIQATLKNEFAGFDVVEASKIENADGTTSYEAEIKKGKEAFDVLLASDGKLLKKTKIERSKEKKD